MVLIPMTRDIVDDDASQASYCTGGDSCLATAGADAPVRRWICPTFARRRLARRPPCVEGVPPTTTRPAGPVSRIGRDTSPGEEPSAHRPVRPERHKAWPAQAPCTAAHKICVNRPSVDMCLPLRTGDGPWARRSRPHARRNAICVTSCARQALKIGFARSPTVPGDAAMAIGRPALRLHWCNLSAEDGFTTARGRRCSERIFPAPPPCPPTAVPGFTPNRRRIRVQNGRSHGEPRRAALAAWTPRWCADAGAGGCPCLGQSTQALGLRGKIAVISCLSPLKISPEEICYSRYKEGIPRVMAACRRAVFIQIISDSNTSYPKGMFCLSSWLPHPALETIDRTQACSAVSTSWR